MPTKKKPGDLRVLNPRGIPAGRHVVRRHEHAEGREDSDDHSTCLDLRFYEGDTVPAGTFPDASVGRFLEHVQFEGASGCDKHEHCAGPYMEEVQAAKEVREPADG